MRVLLRAVAVAAGLAAALVPAAYAHGASLFRGTSAGAAIEVQADSRHVFYLHFDVPLDCPDGISRREEIADTRVPIRLDQTGSFSYVDVFSKGSEYYKAEIRGTMRHGRLHGTYAFGTTGGPCWTGDEVRGTPQKPEGSPVSFSLSRRKGVRFYEDKSLQQRRSANTYLPGSFPHAVYMWVGPGKVYSLTAIVRETCITHQSGFPPSSNSYDLVLTRRQASINPLTHRINVREAERVGIGPRDRQVWRLSALVDPGEVSGRLSHTYNYRPGGGDSLHCQTGAANDPTVEFDAHHS